MKRLAQLLAILLILSACRPVVNTPAVVEPQPLSAQAEPPTPTPVPPPELRGALEIQQLMLTSHTRWQRLQASAMASLYPPPGMNAGTQNTTVQVWIEQPGKARVIAGPPGQAPDHTFISDGSSLRQDGGQPSPLPSGILEPFNPPNTPSDTVYPHPLAGLLGTPVSDLLFPAGLAQRGGEYRLVGKESLANREAYLVEWGRDPGELIDRFWVDTQTGIILRHQSYGKQDSTTPVSDLQLTALQIDPELPASLFDLNDPALPALATPLPTLDPAASQLTIRPDLTQVNLRGGPGTTYPVVGGLYPKQIVIVIGKNEAGDWWAVDLDGQTAWVLAELVDFSGDPDAVPVLPAP
jgi:hypothetical protein